MITDSDKTILAGAKCPDWMRKQVEQKAMRQIAEEQLCLWRIDLTQTQYINHGLYCNMCEELKKLQRMMEKRDEQ